MIIDELIQHCMDDSKLNGWSEDSFIVSKGDHPYWSDFVIGISMA